MPYFGKEKDLKHNESQNNCSTTTDKVSTKVIRPTKEQLEFLSLDSPQCFCSKSAHRSYTLEYGPILECFSYGLSEQDKNTVIYTCGFHVHERSWTKLVTDIKTNLIIPSTHFELCTCPIFNFTFCALFDSTNDYSIISPTELPECFCGLPIKLREKNQGFNGIYFSCVNSNIDGKRKCSWRLKAKEVPFIKPVHRLHTYVDFETYQRNIEERKDVLRKDTESKLQNESIDSLESDFTQLNRDTLPLFSEMKTDFLFYLDYASKAVLKNKDKVAKDELEDVSELSIQERKSSHESGIIKVELGNGKL